jgi:hypothetical protein
LTVEPLEDRFLPATVKLLVTTLADGGAGSLRDAINYADQHPSQYEIKFGVTGELRLSSPLPELTTDVALQGPGAANLVIEPFAGPQFIASAPTTFFVVEAGVTATIDGLTLHGGGDRQAAETPTSFTQDNGGAIANAGTLTVSNCVLTDNAVNGSGGAIFNTGVLTVSHCLLSRNGAWNGGAIDNSADGTLEVEQCALTDDNAVFGGAIDQRGQSVEIIQSTLDSDQAQRGGGVSLSVGELTISQSTLSNNTADYGGGLDGEASSARLNVSTSTLAGNTASHWGGGMFLHGVTATLVSCTVTDNRAGDSLGVGGIDALSGCDLLLWDSLVAGNFQGTAPADFQGPVDGRSSYNLIGADRLGPALTARDQTGLADGTQGNHVGTFTSPIPVPLGPLADNGGPTQTVAPLPGSPALARGGPLDTLARGIDGATTNLYVTAAAVFAGLSAGDAIQIDGEQMTVTAVDTQHNTLTVVRGANAMAHQGGAALFLATDQRGLPRVVNGREDVGAFQTQPPAPPAVAADPPAVAGPAAAAGQAFDLVVPVLVRRHGRLLVVGEDARTGLVVFEQALPAGARNVRTQWQVAADGTPASVVLFRVGRQQHEWLFNNAGIFLGDLG